ncbi:MAG: glycosyltransferase family 4 protein [Actinomycetota bacterium]|nr:glycosyltransferase family 4 protein [Actinomycetota bacterium]
MTLGSPPRVLSGILFFPRGGSAHVARALAHELARHGWAVTLVSGSRSDLGVDGDARCFYAGLDVRPVDFTPALRGALDPMAFDAACGQAPMHPSYEDRANAADRVFGALDDAVAERQVAAWAVALRRADAMQADVLHLHHLTPLNEAAARAAPAVPVVGHLHGTELLFLERIAEGGPPAWVYAERWAQRMRAWAARCHSLVATSTEGLTRAAELLDVPAERLALVPNGFDATCFFPAEIDRVAHWRKHLVERPKGWRPGAGPGSVSYAESELTAFAEGTVLLYVGRFTEVKRVPLLVRAYARARERFMVRAPLVLVGGHPGEWEGEHPIEAIEALGVSDVFLAGWHGHDELPNFLRAADVLILPSVREQFGQVIVEAMACERPAIAVRRYGPAEIVDDGDTGWLVEPDDEAGLVDALVDAVNRPEERARRGRRAGEAARGRYAWSGVSERMASILAAAVRS